MIIPKEASKIEPETAAVIKTAAIINTAAAIDPKTTNSPATDIAGPQAIIITGATAITSHKMRNKASIIIAETDPYEIAILSLKRRSTLKRNIWLVKILITAKMPIRKIIGLYRIYLHPQYSLERPISLL